MEKLGPGDPQRIGNYRLLARLGAGGMGQVFLARSDRGRTVAVKLVRAELAEREEFRARFRQEVRNAQRVGGFWTAPVLDADTEAPVPWVATGYVAGPSLQQVVGQDHGPLPERSVRILAAGLAHALTNIHAAGIVHRDLKPSNVMVTIEGPRVIDFGVARAMESVAGDSGGGLTQTGAMVGSPGFMAPEQVRGGQVTPASDVFCLGSVLVYAATGELPFGAAGSGVHAQLFRIAEEEPDLSGVPEGIADLVRACLRKDPAARPSLARILELSGAHDTVSDGRSRDPWLPGGLVAQLGRHAVRLLEVEDPDGTTPPEDWFGTRAGGGYGAPSYGHGPTARESAVHSHAYEPVAHGYDAAAEAAAPGPGPGTAPAAHPAYGGGAQQHPQPGHGYPAQQPPQPPYNPYADGPPTVPPQGPYDPDEPEEPERGGGRTTALLLVIALVVAVAAGGSVYALLSGGGDDGGGRAVAGAGTAPSGRTTGGKPSAPESASPAPSATGGVVPAGFLGSWRTSFDTEGARNTRRLTIEQGAVGDAVLALVADGQGYHCEFTAQLTRQPGGDGPLEIGPSKVTSGKPRSSCSPGEATEVTLLSGGRLERVNPSTGEKLTYTR